MENGKPGSSTSAGRPGVAGVILALALVAVPLAAATGLSSYEVVKRALLVALGGVALAVWTIGFCGGRRGRVFGGGWSAGILWLFVLYSALSALWAPSLWVALPGLTSWLLLAGVFALVATRDGSPAWIAVPLSLSAGLVAVTVLLTRFGVAVPPDIPIGMAHDAGAHGSFDHVMRAGAFLAMTMPLALYAAAVCRGWLGWLLLLSAILASLAVGIAGGALVVIALSALLLGSLLGLRHLKAAPGALVTWTSALLCVVGLAVGQFALGPAEETPVEEPLPGMATNLYEAYRLDDQVNAVTSRTEWDFEWSRARRVASEALLLGHGVGAWGVTAPLDIDPDHPYYTAESPERHLHDAPNGLITGVLVEQGAAGGLLLLLFLGAVVLSAARGLRRPERSQAPGAGYLAAALMAAGALALLTPVAYHAAGGLALMAVLGLAVRLEAPDPGPGGLLRTRAVPPAARGFPRFERWVLVGGPALLLLIVGAVQQGRRTAADYQRQRGELFLAARQNEEAIESLEGAVALDENDYRAQYYLGLARYYTPTDEARRAAAREGLERAAELWPNDPRVRVQAIRSQLQRAGLGPDERMSGASAARNELRRLIALDPRYELLYEQLAEALQVLGDNEEAAAALLELTTISRDPELLGQTHYAAGRIFEDRLYDPESALHQYQRASEYAREGTDLAHDLPERITYVQEWIEQGSQPIDLSQDH